MYPLGIVGAHYELEWRSGIQAWGKYFFNLKITPLQYTLSSFNDPSPTEI